MLIKQTESGEGSNKVITEVYDTVKERNARAESIKKNSTATVTTSNSRDGKTFTVIYRNYNSDPETLQAQLDGKANVSKKIVEQALKFEYLVGYGVDNWGGYSEAMSAFYAEHPEYDV